MPLKKTTSTTPKPKARTEDQVSAGGVAFRASRSGPAEVAIVSVNPSRRWQLPKGLVDPGESPEMAALREVREEAGIETKLLALIDTIEYWYRGDRKGQAIRYHKYVHFFLLAYLRGDVTDHDHEVAEARWVSLDQAIEMLAFPTERAVVQKARELIAGL
ncbi:MAG: NUDIX hydrolase [Bacteroidota bacterium]